MTDPGHAPTQAITEVLSDRAPVLRRTVRALPDAMLGALARGLDRNADDLVPRRLFRSRKGGGCAVGIMLRELDPARYRSGFLRFWLRDRWRRRSRSYGGELASNPRLTHLEWTFDDAVKRLRRLEMSRGDAALAVGTWIRSEVEAELDRRRTWRSEPSPPAACADDARARLRRGHEREGPRRRDERSAGVAGP